MDEYEALPPGLEPFNVESHEMDDIPTIDITDDNDGDKSNDELEGEEDDNPFADDDDSDEEGGGVQVTIRKVEPSSTFNKAHQQGKLDIDSTPLINEKPIYDIDLAQMEERPWRKPGADITDYFNYGFTEETWNIYCERQKKLRNEFGGNQAKTNQVLFGNIQLVNPLAAPNIPQNVAKWGSTAKPADSGSVVKVLTDNGGRFKPQQSYIPNSMHQGEPVMRTVIGGAGPAPSSAPGTMGPPIIDFSRPPPGMSMPPPGMGLPPMATPSTPAPSMTPSSVHSGASEAPPGIDSSSDRPPGVITPPGASSSSNPPGVSSLPASIPGVPGVPGALDLNLGVPPPGFNPAMPPPGMPPNMGLLSTNLPPPGFNMPMSYPPNHQRAGFGPSSQGMSQRGGSSSYGSGGGGGQSESRRESNDYEEDDDRKARRKRSRSRSPKRETRRRGTERERSDRDRVERTSSRRHRSRSTSTERKRHRDDRGDRDKRRERRDDEERSSKKSSRRRGENDDSDDRRSEKKERKSRHSDEHDILMENGVSAQDLAEEPSSD